MAHFAKLDENNNVLRVSVVNNTDISDEANEAGLSNESQGITFLKNLHGNDTIWKQTSYNSNFRGMYAVVGGVYDPTHDKFIPPNGRINADGDYEEAT